MIEAVIFDMDGVLIDTEPYWHKAEVEVFNAHGVPVTYEDTLTTMGMGIGSIMDKWAEVYGVKFDHDTVAREIYEKMVEFVRAQGQALPGAVEAAQMLAEAEIPLALASSSWHVLIDAVLDRLEIKQYFEVVRSGKDEKNSKPAPDIYLHTAGGLGVAPENCLAIEDSPAGVKSALAAGCKVIAVPPEELKDNHVYKKANIVLSSLEEFSLLTLQGALELA